MILKALLLFFSVIVWAKDVSISQFLNSAWQNGPMIKGELLQNSASEEFISSVRGKYLPHFSADALDTSGFAASNSALGTTGLMGSPFRSGLAGGLVVEQTIYDFGRIHSALNLAKATKSAEQARLAGEKFRFLYTAGTVYISCASVRTLQDIDQQLMSWSLINLKETAKFTRSGQRSVIDNSLVQAEVNSLRLEIDQMKKNEQSLIEQMGLYSDSSHCKNLGESWKAKLPAELTVEAPSLLLAKAQIELSRASYDQAQANQLPTIKAMGSVGSMQDVRLVPREDYAAGIGVVFPFWNGGEDARREKAWQTQTEYQQENLKTSQLDYSVHIKNVKDEFARSQEALTVLEKDLELVRKTMKLATQRYRLLEGPLIDVREAFHQLQAMEFQRVQVMNVLARDTLELGLLGTK